MKEYSSDKIRNVAVVSHDGAGKTALVESLLLTSGAVDFVGKGQDNKHIMDFEPEEIKRNVTIQLGMAPCEWHDHKVNFVDTPGYNEFHGEVRAALRACDGMLMVLSATSGVETDTVRAWDMQLNYKCLAWHLSIKWMWMVPISSVLLKECGNYLAKASCRCRFLSVKAPILKAL